MFRLWKPMPCNWSATRKGGYIQPYFNIGAKGNFTFYAVELLDEEMHVRGNWPLYNIQPEYKRAIIAFLQESRNEWEYIPEERMQGMEF